MARGGTCPYLESARAWSLAPSKLARAADRALGECLHRGTPTVRHRASLAFCHAIRSARNSCSAPRAYRCAYWDTWPVLASIPSAVRADAAPECHLPGYRQIGDTAGLAGGAIMSVSGLTTFPRAHRLPKAASSMGGVRDNGDVVLRVTERGSATPSTGMALTEPDLSKRLATHQGRQRYLNAASTLAPDLRR